MTARGSLLEEVAELSVPQRRGAIAREARRLAGTPELDRLLNELSAGGRYERQTAIHMAVITGARNHLLTQLDSEDPECAGRALTALIRMGVEPDLVVDRVPGLSDRLRTRVFRALSRGDREQLADALLWPMRGSFGDGAAARVLPFCSRAVVAELLPELAYAVPNWIVLGRRHFGVVFDLVGSRAPGAGRDEWCELWRWLTADVDTAARYDPRLLLEVAAQAVAYVPVAELNPVAGMLARYDAAAVYALIRHPSGHGRGLAGTTLWKAMGALPDDRLRELYAACAPRERYRLLRTVPPQRRAVIARPLLARPGIAPGDVDVLAFDALPRSDRAALARELLARPGGSDVPEVAELLTARLPWSAAKPVLAEAIGRSSAEERARAYPLLVTAAAGSRDSAVVGELLDLLRRLRNEQDPVRRNALHAVTTIPMGLLSADHVPALEQLALDALQARDCSYQTMSTIGVLARTLLRRGAQTDDMAFTEAALRLATRLAEQTRPWNLYGLHHDLPRGAEHRLFATLRVRLDDDAARDRWDLALELCGGLGRRAHGIPELQRLMVRACAAHDDGTVRRAVLLALDNPVTRDRHLDEMLRSDRSLVALPAVQNLIARRRTDLLTALLSESTPGRFLSRKIRFVPMLLTGFDRWAPHHVDRYAGLLDSLARHKKASIGERAAAVRQLGWLPGSFDRLLAYVGTDELTVVEAALTALGRSDEPERALAVLAEHVDTDRARVAVSGIAVCARAVPPQRLSHTVAPLIDSRKVTSVKEGVRVLAMLHAPDAMPTIHALWDRHDVHRDIRRAAVFSTRWLLDHEEAWQLLGEAATDPEVAGAVLDIAPPWLSVPQRRRFATFLRELAAVSDHRVAGQALNALTRWYRWSPPDTSDVLVDRLSDLSESGLWMTAMRALLDGVAADGDPAVIAAVDRLLHATATLPGRDLPARQRLSTLLKWLGPALRNHDVARPVAAPVIDLLTADPLWHEQVIDLTLAAVRWTEPEQTIDALTGLSAVATGALTGHPASRLADRVAHDLEKIPAEALAPIAAGLAASSAALAAVDLIAQCGNKFGWTPPWPELLADLRSHTDIDVRRAAHSVYTAPE
ncbi:hypothetical protein HLB23_21800 [Nocardia uniformis]|uniref:Uncharacterized protein n=1 Tax=Nocardia uniformis TaxID=53432 RepID=A0A849C7V4_9NOCA|nr:HEAT repeat domain-containing protein [Nocardia uniformis]NNH72460.1 hypothetical protein [Nocardia uniformis]